MILTVEILDKKFKELQTTKLNFAPTFSTHSNSIYRKQPSRTVQLWFFELYQKGEKTWNEFLDFNIKNKNPICVDFSNFQFLSDIDFTGYQFLNVDFSNCRFSKSVRFGKLESSFANFSNVNFLKAVSFEFSIFDNINFTGATFHSQTIFFKTVFKAVNFTKASFRAGINFDKITFQNTLYFDGQIFANAELTLQDVNFMQDVSFKNCTFNNLNLLNTKFQKDCFFRESYFQNVTCFDSVKFFGSVIFANSVFQSKVDFYKIFFAKGASFISSKFKQEVNFYALEFYTKAISFYRTYFASNNFFQISKSNSIISFHYVVFKDIPEFDLNSTQGLEFCAVEFALQNQNASWFVEHNILNKLAQLSLIAKNTANKDLINKTFELKQKISTKVQFLFLSQSLLSRWSTTNAPWFIKCLLFPLFIIFWILQVIVWALKQISDFIWAHGFGYGKSYLKPTFYLILLYPLFYFLYGNNGKIGSCTLAESHNFLLAHYIPFSNNFTFFNNIQTKCFLHAENLSIFYLSFLQTILGFTFFMLITVALYYKFSVFISKSRLASRINLRRRKNLSPLQLTTNHQVTSSKKIENTKIDKTDTVIIVPQAPQASQKESKPLPSSKSEIAEKKPDKAIIQDDNLSFSRQKRVAKFVANNLLDSQKNKNTASDLKFADQKLITDLEQRIDKSIKRIPPQQSYKRFSTQWPFIQAGSEQVAPSFETEQKDLAITKQADKKQENFSITDKTTTTDEQLKQTNKAQNKQDIVDIFEFNEL